MAEQTDIDAIKKLLPADSTWTDEEIGALLDAGNSSNRIFEKYWQKVASDAYAVVSISESGSSRSLEQIYKNALELAKYYGDLAKAEEQADDPDLTPRGRISFHQITRV